MRVGGVPPRLSHVFSVFGDVLTETLIMTAKQLETSQSVAAGNIWEHIVPGTGPWTGPSTGPSTDPSDDPSTDPSTDTSTDYSANRRTYPCTDLTVVRVPAPALLWALLPPSGLE